MHVDDIKYVHDLRRKEMRKLFQGITIKQKKVKRMVKCEDCGKTGGKWYKIVHEGCKPPQVIALCGDHVNQRRRLGQKIVYIKRPDRV